MQSASQFLIALGGILLLGLVTDILGRRTHLPRVTLLLIFGVIIGKDLLDIIPAVFSDRFEIIANMALLSEHFPEYRQTLLSVIISTTIFFEIIGPVFTRMALQRTRNA